MTHTPDIAKSIKSADVAYVITVQGDTVSSFVVGQGCPCCQTDTIVEALLDILTLEAESNDAPPILNCLLDAVNDPELRQN